MIAIRNLMEKDAPLMLEWMHDNDIQRRFIKDMMGKTLEEVKDFCSTNSDSDDVEDGSSRHFAVVDTDDDEYLGTISLKDISVLHRRAEYAISLRRKAWGQGIAFKATQLLLEKAFNEYGLHRVYLNVLEDNLPAIYLYEKCGFCFEGEFREHIKKGGEYLGWRWYSILKDEFNTKRD